MIVFDLKMNQALTRFHRCEYVRVAELLEELRLLLHSDISASVVADSIHLFALFYSLSNDRLVKFVASLDGQYAGFTAYHNDSY